MSAQGLRSRARKLLAMLLQASRLHAPSNVRAKLFAEAAGVQAYAFEQVRRPSNPHVRPSPIIQWTA